MRFQMLFSGLLLLVFSTALLAQSSVRIADLSEVLIDLERRAPAEVKPLNDARLSAEVAAVVQRIHADVGQAVRAGDLLIELDQRDYQLILDQATAALASSEARKASADIKLSRAENLVKDQYLSDDTLLDRKTDVAVLSAQIQADEVTVAIARRNLEKCRIRAPFDGVVSSRDAQVGAFVVNGSPLLQIVQIDRFELDSEVAADVADSLLQADEIRFESRGESWPLRLQRLSPVIESERRTRRARLTFEGQAPPVGRSGELVWRVDDGLLPSSFIVRRGGQLGVFVHVEGTAEFIPLPRAQEGRPAEIDLPARTEVITLGRDRLQPGDAISVSR